MPSSKLNTTQSDYPLLTINLSNITKLTTTNYITWSLQIRTLLEGYDLHGFIDGTSPSSQPKVTSGDTTSTNPAYLTWKRQDRLIFFALLGAISPSLLLLLTLTYSFKEAWGLLANIYAKPSCRRIKQIKDQIKTYTKGTKRVSEYMQFIRTRADELALLGKPMDK